MGVGVGCDGGWWGWRCVWVGAVVRSVGGICGSVWGGFEVSEVVTINISIQIKTF